MKNVCTLFGVDSNSRRRSDRDANTIVRGHSKRGYGGNGIGCRRSIENVQLLVRSRGAVVHIGSEKEKDVLGSRALKRSRPPVQWSSTVRIRTYLVNASLKGNGHAVLTEGFRGLDG